MSGVPRPEGHRHSLLPRTLSGTDLLRVGSSGGAEYVHPMVSHSQLQDLRKKAGCSALLELGREPAARRSGPIHPRHSAGRAQTLQVLLGTPKSSQNLSPGPACIRPHEPENTATSGDSSREEPGLQTETSRDPLRLGTHPSFFGMDRGKEKTFPTPTRVSLETVYIKALSLHILPLSHLKKNK